MLVILPKFAPPNPPFGEENSGRLNALKDSTRNCRRTFSLIVVVLNNDRSKLFLPAVRASGKRASPISSSVCRWRKTEVEPAIHLAFIIRNLGALPRAFRAADVKRNAALSLIDHVELPALDDLAADASGIAEKSFPFTKGQLITAADHQSLRDVELTQLFGQRRVGVVEKTNLIELLGVRLRNQHTEPVGETARGFLSSSIPL